MDRARSIFLYIFCFVLLTAMGTNAPSGSDKDPVSPYEIDKLDKQRAPEFSLKDLNGRTITLSSMKGKVVLLNFWATWCPPCLSEMPKFNALYKSMRGRGLEVIAISADRSESYLKDYISENRLEFIVLYDRDRSVVKRYKVFSMPTTFLIDKNGFIMEKFFGEYDWTDREIKQKIEKLL